MQSFTQIQSTQSIQSSLALLLSNDRTALSNSSGTAFPTVGVEIGMTCYRTDQKKIYALTSITPTVTWTLMMDLSAVVNPGDDPVAQAAQLAYAALARRTSGDDGGRINFEKPESGSTLAGNVSFRIKGNQFQIFDIGSNNGFYLDLGTALASVGGKIWHSGNDGAGSGLDADMLDGKNSGNATGQIPVSNGTLNVNLNAEMLNGKKSNVYALLESPQFTGAPTVPTAAIGNNTTQVANTAYVLRALSTIDLASRVAKTGDTMTGQLVNMSGSIKLYGWSGNTNSGVVFLNSAGDRYLYYDGGRYNLPGATLVVNGSEVLTNAGGGNSVSLAGATSISVGLSRSGTSISPVLTVGNCNCNCNCDCFSTCFPAGQMVLMGDGHWQEITTIKAGDMVMGPTGLWEVDYLYNSMLGTRTMYRTPDGKMTWTEEHLIWSRLNNKEWWWSARAETLRHEVSTGLVMGLFDNYSIMEGGQPQFANIDKVWADVRLVDVTHEFTPETKVYEPIAKNGDRMAFMGGYLVTSSTNQWEFDYSEFKWDATRAAHVRALVKQ